MRIMSTLHLGLGVWPISKPDKSFRAPTKTIRVCHDSVTRVSHRQTLSKKYAAEWKEGGQVRKKSRENEFELGGLGNLGEVATVLGCAMDSHIALVAVQEIQNTPIFTWSTEKKF